MANQKSCLPVVFLKLKQGCSKLSLLFSHFVKLDSKSLISEYNQSKITCCTVFQGKPIVLYFQFLFSRACKRRSWRWMAAKGHSVSIISI